jgi:hypothetical protein
MFRITINYVCSHEDHNVVNCITDFVVHILMPMSKPTPSSIRFDPELKADLQAMADDDDRSFSYIVEKLLRNSVSEWKAKRKQARKC